MDPGLFLLPLDIEFVTSGIEIKLLVASQLNIE